MSLTSQERFKSNVLTLIDIFKEIFEEGHNKNVIENYSNTFFIVETIVGSTPSERMVKNFIKRTHTEWDKIKEKDIEYFKQLGLNFFNIFQNKGVDDLKKNEKQSQIIQLLTGGQINDFKKLLESSYKDSEGNTLYFLNEERKKDIWLIFHSFIKISLCYLHENPDFYSTLSNDIDLQQNILKWKIKKLIN